MWGCGLVEINFLLLCTFGGVVPGNIGKNKKISCIIIKLVFN